ncbi:DNA polymerase III subunit delta [Siminovitchia sp. 179-K 8D1 HS]|uniref:DNA polymerase III subunit delta n=1 Tax=Siminovitchia sp. 179-K 8D1 HS TaxID=3142385 RepID=UPI0039A30D88
MAFLKRIEEKKFSPLYLLYGTEPFLINEAKEKLMANVLTEEEMEFDFSSYDLEEASVDEAIEDAETLPFMGDKKLIMLHNPVFLTALKAKEKVTHDLKKLEAYVENPAPFTVLVFTGEYEKLDERKKLVKLLKKNAEVLEAKPLEEKSLKKWVKNRAASLDVMIEERAIDLLRQLAGNDLMILSEEISKLALYAADSKRITEDAVEKLISRSLEQNIFALVDKVVKRDIKEALRIFYDLLKQNEEPIKILAVLSGQFRLIYQVKELTARGYGQKQIAGMLKVHPYRVKLAAGQAGSFSSGDLIRIMDMLAESDLKLKSTGMDKKVVIELFLMQLVQLK